MARKSGNRDRLLCGLIDIWTPAHNILPPLRSEARVHTMDERGSCARMRISSEMHSLLPTESTADDTLHYICFI